MSANTTLRHSEIYFIAPRSSAVETKTAGDRQEHVLFENTIYWIFTTSSSALILLWKDHFANSPYYSCIRLSFASPYQQVLFCAVLGTRPSHRSLNPGCPDRLLGSMAIRALPLKLA